MEIRVNRQSNVSFSAALLCLAIALLTSCETTSLSRERLQPAGFFDTVVLDAGHGGHDTGARAVSKAAEKHLNLDTARRTATLLRQAGLRVVETRTEDYFVPLDTRVRMANNIPNAAFVSIHYNWAKRSKATGIETYYGGPRSSRLAANIQRETLRAYRTKNRGVKFHRYYVLRNSIRPAVLCELGFVSNATENRTLQNAATRQQLAEAIARGILAEKAGRTP
jgi:N-acetylmuramoyl-L-alanine amidase